MTVPGLCVHGVVRAGHRLAAVRGAGGPAVPVRVVTEGPVAAVVSRAAEPPLPGHRDLMAHQDLLAGLAEEGPVLPMRFGTLAPDETVLRRQLAAAEREHLACLRRVAGRIEINVRAMPAAEGLAGLAVEDGRVSRLRADAHRHPGRDANVRLGAAVADALRRRAEEAGRQIVGELSPLAHEVCAGPRGSDCALNVSFLVDRSATDDFLRTVALAAGPRRDEVELRVAGPLPCYSFSGSGRPSRGPGDQGQDGPGDDRPPTGW